MNVRNRLRDRVRNSDELSTTVLELSGMVVTTLTFTILGEHTPQDPRETILMREDNMSAVHWVNHSRGSKEPRSGALMRIPGCLDAGSGWCSQAKHLTGVANTLADGISRWDRASIPSDSRAFRPDVKWQEQDLGRVGADFVQESWNPVHPSLSCGLV